MRLSTWLWGTLAVQLLSAALFLSGFVLPRQVVTETSPPLTSGRSAADAAGAPAGSDEGAGVPAAQRYGGHKVVLVIVDALRYDMVVGDARRLRSLGGKGWLLRSESPTTTAQRLRAMTTGGVPAYMELGTAFNSDEVLQDSLLRQLRLHERSAAVLGDDTWVALYPEAGGYWAHAGVYPSFNVWDLDTVDSGVKESLRDLYVEDVGGGGRDGRRSTVSLKYDFNVLHLLGVDHAGHRYGPRHPEMDRKLEETDVFLQHLTDRVLSRLPRGERTMLLVIGDHGMTEDGQHGGGTALEVATVLHLRAFGDAAWDGASPHDGADARAELEQVDLVPTLALLLGVATPHGNLGLPSRAVLRHACLGCTHAEERRRYVAALLGCARQVVAGLEAEAACAAAAVDSARRELDAAAVEAAAWLAAVDERGDGEGEGTGSVVLAERGEGVARALEGVVRAAKAAARESLATMRPSLLYAGVAAAALPVAGWWASSVSDVPRCCGEDGGGGGTWSAVPLLLPALLAVALSSNSYVVREESVVGFLLVTGMLAAAARGGSAASSIALTGAAAACRGLPGVLSRTQRAFGTHALTVSLPVHDVNGVAEVFVVALLPLLGLFWFAVRRGAAPLARRGLRLAPLYGCILLHFACKAAETPGGGAEAAADQYRVVGRLAATAAWCVAAAGWAAGWTSDVWAAAAMATGPRSGPVWLLLRFAVDALERAPAVAVGGGSGRGALLYLTGWLGFFCTGHQAVISAIDFGSAFVGFDRLHHTLQGVVLVVFNTFAPLLVDHARPSGLVLSSILVTTGAFFAAAHHRQHLMVWEVFAPRMLFAAAAAPLVTLAAIVADARGRRQTGA